MTQNSKGAEEWTMKSPSHSYPSHRVTFLWQPVILGSYLSPQRDCVNRQAHLPFPHIPSVHKWIHSGLGGVPLSAILWWRGCSLTPERLTSVASPIPHHPIPTQSRLSWSAGRLAQSRRVTGWAHRAPCQLSQSPLLG